MPPISPYSCVPATVVSPSYICARMVPVGAKPPRLPSGEHLRTDSTSARDVVAVPVSAVFLWQTPHFVLSGTDPVSKRRWTSLASKYPKRFASDLASTLLDASSLPLELNLYEIFVGNLPRCPFLNFGLNSTSPRAHPVDDLWPVDVSVTGESSCAFLLHGKTHVGVEGALSPRSSL